MGLEDKICLVTGASRVIGAATVRALAAEDALAVIHYASNRAAAEALAGHVGSERCHLVSADLADPMSAYTLWDEALSWRGRIDVLVNNAGIYEPGSVDGDDDAWAANWARTLNVNLVAAANLYRAAVRHFREGQGGIIINIASRAAFRGDAPDYTAYAASKGGMIALTRTIARAYAADGVLAYAIAPGFVATDMVDDFATGNDFDKVIDEIPLGEIAPPEEVANIAAFLASGRARHATGATFDINGASYVR